MNRLEIIEEIIKRSKEKDIEEIEIYVKQSSSTEINIYEGNVENYFISDEEDLSLRGIYKGHMGYSYTEKLAKESIEELLENLIQYAQNNENEYIESMTETIDSFEKQDEKNLLDGYSDEQKIEFLLDLEEKALAVSDKIKTISDCNYKEKTENIYIKNTLGLEVEETHTTAWISLGTVAEEDGNMQSAYSNLVIKDLTEDLKDVLIRESTGDALDMLGAEPISSGRYKVILRNNVMADMMSYFLPVFSASQVQKGLSLMKGKTGKTIGAPTLNMIEDPNLKEGAFNRSFDDEGTLTEKKHIIKDGILQTLLHSKKTAEKEGEVSTANGFRRSHKSSIEVIPTNIYLEEGSKSLDDLLKQMNEGIIITDIHGLHAGINPTSGDFALSSNGFLIENGSYKRPLEQITIAGNLYDMLKEIQEIGNDIKFSHPSSDYLGSPSILISGLSISGK
nr:TldD/PmbA family protein [Tissierella sp.]